MSAMAATMCAKGATMRTDEVGCSSPKDPSMSAKDAIMSAKYATMSAKDATMTRVWLPWRRP